MNNFCTNSDTNNSTLPVPTELTSCEPITNRTEHTQSTPHNKHFVPWYVVVIALLTIILLFTSVSWYQSHQYSICLLEEAFVLSLNINVLEENLLLEYGLFPEDVGLDELRSEWYFNPCYETAMEYFDGLFTVYECLIEDSEESVYI